MNSEEGMSLAKMAVTVLLVVLIIAAVVTLVYQAYKWFNQGSDKLEGQVTSIGASSYSNYDDTMVSGTNVISALDSNRSSGLAVVIVNLQNNQGAYNPSNPGTYTQNALVANYCARIDGSTDSDGGTPAAPKVLGPCVKLGAAVPTGAQQVAAPAAGEVRYNGVKGCFECTNLQYDNSMVVNNTNFSPTKDSSRTLNYVKETGSFYSKLIYSTDTGEVCGIIFLQVQ